jgi:hypothetical protein
MNALSRSRRRRKRGSSAGPGPLIGRTVRPRCHSSEPEGAWPSDQPRYRAGTGVGAATWRWEDGKQFVPMFDGQPQCGNPISVQQMDRLLS